MSLAPIPDPFPPTREALHGYASVLGAVTRAHAVPRPHWWHLGLEVRSDGLATVPVPLPGDDSVELRLDPERAAVMVTTADSGPRTIDLAGLSPGALANEVAAILTDLGLDQPIDRAKIPDGPVAPDWDVAARYMGVLRGLADTFERRRETLDAAGPVLVWPHGFDVAFEWFGTKTVTGEDGAAAPAQLNLGFSPDDGGYLYSNPWPFDAALTSHELPHGARWHVDGWQGTILPYAEVAGLPDGPERVLEYAAAVHRIARPTLDARGDGG